MQSDYPYNCPNCQKKYKRHIYFSRHKLACCPASLTECIDPPPVSLDMLSQPSQVMQVLEHLVASNNSLRRELMELKTQSRAQNKAIDLISWLNKSFTPDQEFKSYMDTKITRKDLEMVFENNLIDAIKKLFIRQFKQVDKSPYKAFEKKVNIIYVFTGSDGWKILSLSDFAPFIKLISHGFAEEFQKWQDENYERLFSESFSETYLTNIKKINKINLNTNQSLNMLYKILYNHLKVPLDIIEYEIK
jgi:hypothetical protein